MNKNDTATIHTLIVTSTIDECPPTLKDLMLFVVALRRGIRKIVSAMDEQYDKARQYRRQARILKGCASPFDAARIATSEGWKRE